MEVVGQKMTSVLDVEDPILGKSSADLNGPPAHSLSWSTKDNKREFLGAVPSQSPSGETNGCLCA